VHKQEIAPTHTANPASFTHHETRP
jgi:hypothetical protein